MFSSFQWCSCSIGPFVLDQQNWFKYSYLIEFIMMIIVKMMMIIVKMMMMIDLLEGKLMFLWWKLFMQNKLEFIVLWLELSSL